MAKISYDVEVLQEGRNYHDFEVACPHCSERGIAVLDGREMRITDIRKGRLGKRGKAKNVLLCDNCSCVFKVDPRIEAEKETIEALLREMKSR